MSSERAPAYIQRRHSLPRRRTAHLFSTRVMVVSGVEIARDQQNVLLAPGSPRVGRPAAHLRIEGCPIGGQLVVAPMNLRAVTSYTVGRVEQLSPRIRRSRRRLGEDCLIAEEKASCKCRDLPSRH